MFKGLCSCDTKRRADGQVGLSSLTSLHWYATNLSVHHWSFWQKKLPCQECTFLALQAFAITCRYCSLWLVLYRTCTLASSCQKLHYQLCSIVKPRDNALGSVNPSISLFVHALIHTMIKVAQMCLCDTWLATVHANQSSQHLLSLFWAAGPVPYKVEGHYCKWFQDWPIPNYNIQTSTASVQEE